MGTSCGLSILLVLTVITVTGGQTQYFDIYQGLQQLFQPYPGNDFIKQYDVATRAPTHKQTNRQESKKKTIEHRHQNDDRRTKKPSPINQYDYVFATTEKSSRQTTKSLSSQYNHSNNFSNKNEYSNILLGDYYNPYEITTNRINRVKTTTTTEANYFNFYNNNNANRGTTQNVFSNNFNVARPVTDNVYENVNHRETYTNNNQARPTNTFNNGANLENENSFSSNRNPQNDRNRGTGNVNNNRGTMNTDYNINYPNSQTNNRRNNGFLNTDFNPEYNNGNTGVNFNRGTPASNSNNRGTWNNNWANTNTGGFYYPPDNPVINRPGVQPVPVYEGRPPITNRPVTESNSFASFNRPSDQSSGTFTDQTRQTDRQPQTFIGPDEDNMSERQKRQFVEKAERMCDYYKSLTVKKIVALPLLPSPDPREVNVSDCTPINVPLVIGGTVTSIREFPHMALVGWTKIQVPGYSWKCGGSLISDRYVLTAGHCIYLDKDANVISGPPHAVQLGSSYLDDPGALVVKISAVIRHPKYMKRRSYHDIALIQMASRVKFSEVIRPACLGRPPPEGRSIIATGWGRTEFGGDHSYVLRSVSLNVWNMRECKEIWGTSLKLPDGVNPESHMCAGDRDGGHDTCQGDSGGPAQIQDGCLWRVVGVTSYGRSCGAPDTPALYAVVPHAFVAAQVFSERA